MYSAAVETIGHVAKEAVGAFICLCAALVVAAMVEIAYLFTGERKEVTWAHIQSGGRG